MIQVKFTLDDKAPSANSEQKAAAGKNSVSPQFGSSIRSQTYVPSHPAFPGVANKQQQQHQQQDYLTSLRNMANNYGGMGGGYPMQNMYGGGAGGMRGGAMPGWGGGQQAAPKSNYAPMNMGTATYNHLQSSGFDGNATANWWNGPGNFFF